MTRQITCAAGGEMTVTVGQVGSPLRLTGQWIIANKTVTPSG